MGINTPDRLGRQGQPGNKTTRIAVLLCAVAEMLKADEGLTPPELAQQVKALSQEDKAVFLKLLREE